MKDTTAAFAAENLAAYATERLRQYAEVLNEQMRHGALPPRGYDSVKRQYIRITTELQARK